MNTALETVLLVAGTLSLLALSVAVSTAWLWVPALIASWVCA